MRIKSQGGIGNDSVTNKAQGVEFSFHFKTRMHQTALSHTVACEVAMEELDISTRHASKPRFISDL